MRPLRKIIFTRTVIIVLAILCFILGYFAGSNSIIKPVIVEGVQSASLSIPAIMDNGKGVVANLIVEVHPGSGRVLTDIDSLVFWADTQKSIQIAKQVAQKYTRKDLSRVDLVYRVKAENVALIEGQSAGAALALATIAAIKNVALKENVSVTGALDKDGNLIKVGGVKAKADASKALGITTFIVPRGQAKLELITPKKVCKTLKSVEVCNINYERMMLSDIGIDVKEATNIREAAAYFGMVV